MNGERHRSERAVQRHPSDDDQRLEVRHEHAIGPSAMPNTAIENMAAAFGGASPAAPQISEKEVEKLHAKIGQLVIERDFLSAASSLILGTGGKKR